MDARVNALLVPFARAGETGPVDVASFLQRLGDNTDAR
jgi:hypothetical protein